MKRINNSQKAFVAVTLLTLLAVSSVLVIYATLLGTFQGSTVEVVSVQGTVYYSLDNSTGWATTLSNLPITDPWYARFNVTSTDGYSGASTVAWKLYNSSSLIHTVTTSWSLSGSAEAIYASSNGAQGTNYNWGQNTTVAESYYIEITVEST